MGVGGILGGSIYAYFYFYNDGLVGVLSPVRGRRLMMAVRSSCFFCVAFGGSKRAGPKSAVTHSIGTRRSRSIGRCHGACLVSFNGVLLSLVSLLQNQKVQKKEHTTHSLINIFNA